MTAIENVLRRERVVIVAGLTALTLLAVVYLWQGAGMGMTALSMTKLAFFPHLTPEPMPDMAMPSIGWLTVVAMWWIMMIAMMIPSAAPLILLYARVMRHAHTDQSQSNPYIFGVLLLAGYLAVWLGFSVVATCAQYALQRAGVISSMMLWSQSAVLSALVLAAAGLYQLSSLKTACLRHCRSPAQSLVSLMRKGKLGAVQMGLEHGFWCVGCCWALMALLFVGGVMNLVWIALLAILVLVEKVIPAGARIGRVTGGLLIAWSIATLAVR